MFMDGFFYVWLNVMDQGLISWILFRFCKRKQHSLILQHCLNIFIFNISVQTLIDCWFLFNFFLLNHIKYCFNVFQCWKNIILTIFQCWNVAGWSKAWFLRAKMYIKYHEEAEKYQDLLHLIHSLSSWVCLMLCDVTGPEGWRHGGGRWKRRRGVEREIHGPRGPALQVPWTDERDPRAHGRKGPLNALHLGPRVPSLGLLVCSRTFKNHYIRPHAEQVKLNLPQLLLK